MNNTTNFIEEFKKLGFDNNQIEEIIRIGEQEIVDQIIKDFTLNADERVVEEYTQKLQNAGGDINKINSLLHEIIAIQYGQENIIKKKDELLSKFLQETIDLTKQTRNLYEKYSQGDPEAIKIVEETKESPDAQNLMKQLQEESQDNG